MTNEQVEKLECIITDINLILSDVKFMPPDNAVAMTDILTQKIEALREAIDTLRTLPVTKDGVIVTCGM